MNEVKYTVTVAAIDFICFPRKYFRGLVNAADRVYNPNLISDTDASVLAAIAHKCTVFGLWYLISFWGICIFKRPRKVSFDVMRMNMVACGYILCGVTNRVAVFYYVFTLFNILKSNFVSVMLALS